MDIPQEESIDAREKLLKIRDPGALSAPRFGSQPLWKIFPTKDADGNLLSDFLMIMPGFRKLSGTELSGRIQTLHEILESYKHAVVFAELSLKNRSLLVSVRPIPGICIELPMLIHAHIPEAKLVSS